jgi:DNA polymerase zeta
MEQKFGKIIKLKGRVIINLWRILESELKLTNYSIENIVFHVLKIREAEFSRRKLLEWYKSNDCRKVVYSLLYYMKRTTYNLILLDELDFINRDVQFTKSIS